MSLAALHRSRWLLLPALSGVLLLSSGCAGWLRPIGAPGEELCQPVRCVPSAKRDRVHVFMVNGMTPFPQPMGSLQGVATYVEQLGLKRPRVHSHYARWSFLKDIRRIRQDDPEAQFVLVGYSYGGSVVRDLATRLDREKIDIQLLVYIDAFSFGRDLDQVPGNVRRVVNIVSEDPVLHGPQLPGHETLTVKNTWHLQVPRNEQTLTRLAEELAHVCGDSALDMHEMQVTHEEPISAGVEDAKQPGSRRLPSN